MRLYVMTLVTLLGAVLAAVAFAGGSGHATAQADAKGHLTPRQQALVSGAAAQALEDANAPAALAPQQQALSQTPTNQTGCPVDRGSNVRVNQNCLNLTDPDLAGRAQAQNETSIAQDPKAPGHLVGSSNDYRRGDGGCYTSYSTTNGRTWADSTPPISYTRGDAFGFLRQYWQASGDTSVAWDTKGNAYLSCQTFNRGQPVSANPDQSSGLYVLRSTGTGGASWNFPARPVAEFKDTAGEGTTLLDKQLMTIDNHEGSPFQDRIYVTYTLFAADGTSYIYESYSADYGEHFSAPVLVSRDSDLCPLQFGVPTPRGRCNVNQFSQPFTGADGALYVTWANFNVTDVKPAADADGGGDNLAPAPAGKDNRDQVLLARSTDGGRTFSAPVKVADYYDLPDCATYQQGKDEGRACVPEKGPTANSYFRAANYPVGAVDPVHPKRVLVSFGSYLNRHSNEANGCVPKGFNPDTFQALYEGVKAEGACNNDIVVSRSDNAGASFTGTSTNVRKLPSARADDKAADQWFQWAAFDPEGRFAVSSYDRAYGNDEKTGFSDFSLSGSRNGSSFATKRVTTGSMPPPTQFGGTFWGDYTGMSAEGSAHPIWSDTRDPELFACLDGSGKVAVPPAVCTMPGDNADPANDENAYTTTTPVPVP